MSLRRYIQVETTLQTGRLPGMRHAMSRAALPHGLRDLIEDLGPLMLHWTRSGDGARSVFAQEHARDTLAFRAASALA
jgi:hypothetical protein